MNILYLGHAGMYIETEEGSILCDPWFNPAYFASWWPFPANDHVPVERFNHPTYLYISHAHLDHFDAQFLKEFIDKSATVLLPAYPLPTLEDALRDLGFHRFQACPNGALVRLGERLEVGIEAFTAPSDGPIGDSCLFINDGTTRLLNLNDAHPRDLEALATHWGPIDGLFLQFSGAIWYPVVYELPEATMAELGRTKRTNEMRRAEIFIRALRPRYIFPSAGPPAFLDPALFQWNDLNNEATNTFPDQTVFLDLLVKRDISGGHLVLPGSDVVLGPDGCEVSHHFPGETEATIFEHKVDYLRRYQARMLPRLEQIKATWPEAGPTLLDDLRQRLQPIMAVADLTARQIGGSVVLDWGTDAACLDFRRRRVVRWDQKPVRYYFRVDATVLAACVAWGLEDWVNALFLSFRFRARREGSYNEAVYTFFKCLSPERIQYAEGYWMETHSETELWQCGGWLVQRRCPHLKADLRRFGVLEGHVLTCQMHGWQFDLDTGECLTADNRTIYRRIAPSSKSPPS